MRADSDRETVLADYLGRRAAAAADDSADESDECDDRLGFAEDKDLLVRATPCQAPPSLAPLWRP